MKLDVTERFWINLPQWSYVHWGRPSKCDFLVPFWKCWGGHGGDEWGNCSVYFTSALLGGLTYFPRKHFQRKILLPEWTSSGNAWSNWYEHKFDHIALSELSWEDERERATLLGDAERLPGADLQGGRAGGTEPEQA